MIISNIYASRDSKEDMEKISSEILVQKIHHRSIQDGKTLSNTLSLIEAYDIKHPNSSIILLQWAWDVDTLRYKIKTS